jgi:glycosyltransferase involved in cell wall biosynthesis
MRIGMILKHKIPPPDIRVEKEAKTLTGEGHDVHLLLEARPGQGREEEYKGMHLVRGVGMGRLREIYHRYTFNFTFTDTMWRSAIRDFCRDREIEVLHVHDLPLVKEALTVGKELGIPVVADLHENFPAGLQVWYESRLKKRTIYNLGRWSRYELEMLGRVDAVIAVVEESRDRLVGLGVPREKVFVVPNTASLDREQIPIDPNIVERYRDRFVLSYIGGFAPHRGLDTVIAGMQVVHRSIPEALLVLVGDGNDAYRRVLERFASMLGCRESVEMTGWQPFEKIWSYIEASDICLVPHSRNPHTDTTIPHKIFQYMSLGKPVIVSDCPPLERVVDDSGGGVSFAHPHSALFAHQVISLYRDPARRKAIQLGEHER